MENNQNVNEIIDTFVVRGEWLDNISTLPVEYQDKIIADIIRYGVRKPTVYDNDPIVFSMVNMLKGRIDNSIDVYKKKVDMSKSAGRKKTINDKVIYDMAREGKNAAQIAEALGCSKSAIDHSEGWKSRKIEDKEFVF